ncbi:FAD-dependent oxidoreductase [Amycolatopsis sp. PS_44_ISF1]|uniref:FAD-dependent oxidoreductase n=1 Tax=Amycolatopsis sp. PS_44_ISF1 TaxID=2974917 RepID=UPI0028DDE65A|nr:FAD-dependent oxidoreductase [Amycolatopsis sp. PS_44_ISF1]MDT8912574.1 FAD-dependent monooxygenase [Amycolatopsis sp. PS_44_ISF1]
MPGYDVVVAGGGPAGLMLAAELRIGGASVIVLERRAESSPMLKAGTLNRPSVEALYRRGLLPEVRRAQAEPEWSVSFLAGAGGRPRFAGHFAAIPLTDELPAESDPELAGLHPPDLVDLVHQRQVEAILARHAAGLGVPVRRGAAVTGFREDVRGVTVEAAGERFRCGWLVGCDGGRSTVRKLAGFDFPGTEPEITAYHAVAEMDGLAGLATGWHTTPAGVYVNDPPRGRITTIAFGGAPSARDTPATAADLRASIRHVTGAEVTITGITSLTRFTPAGLLDTYTAERHPLGAWVLGWTRAQIALMRPDPHARALREVVAALARTADGATYFAKMISGLRQRYELPGEHPLIGASAPDYALVDGSRLADHLHDGRALLLDSSGSLREPAAAYAGRLRLVTTAPADAPAVLFVRPDGYVAWAGEVDRDALEPVLESWLGPPRGGGG